MECISLPADTIPEHAQEGVLALGNFDGVHKGHQEIIRQTIALAKAAGKPSAIMTFDPHPRQFFQPEAHHIELTPLAYKLELLEALGIDVAFIQRFDHAFSLTSASQFMHEILFRDIHASHIVVGHDFIFGHNRQGNSEMLDAACKENHVGFTRIVPQLDETGQRYASTMIRNALLEGDVVKAAEMLGRPYIMRGEVEHGDKRGGQLGFPTANIKPLSSQEIARGVYAVRLRCDGAAYDGVANFGMRPTFDGESLLLEVHLFDFDEDVYGKAVEVAFESFIRPEKKFEGLDMLKAQIQEDISQAKEELRA